MGCKSTFVSLIFFFLYITGRLVLAQTKTNVFNIKNYGAVDDGKSDTTEALGNAWNEACKSNEHSVVLIPEGTYMVNRLVLEGPCKDSIDIELKGTLKAPEDMPSPSRQPWISIRHVNNMTVSGGGTLDGQGAKAWKDCLDYQKCDNRPSVSLNFDFVNNSRIHDITSINSKNVHLKVYGSNDVNLYNINIRAPGEKSVNTDGIYIAISRNVTVSDSKISTGDDCIAFGPGANDINITNIYCGPGHGISIGSLGGRPNEAAVDNIRVSNCTLTGTTNGVRIKTWASPNHNTVSNITFEHLQMKNVSNPITIQQNYCPSKKCDPKGQSNIEIQNVEYNDIWGTSNSEVAVDLQCSGIKPCKNIQLKDINLDFINDKQSASSSCSNVDVVTEGKQNPKPCS